MYRRIVALILLPFVLTSQSVTFGHCHGGDSPTGHDPRPHVHLGVTGGESREERPRCKCHRHHGEDAAPVAKQEPPPPDQAPCGSQVIFLGGADDAVVGRANADPEVVSSFWCIAPLVPALTQDLARLARGPFTRPPPSSPQHCPLYVRHLTFLI